MKVAVLGGGVAGLSAGLTLRRAGADVTVFEADAAPGGKILSIVQDGFLFEDGPNSLTAQSPLTAALAQELALEPLPVRPPKTRYVVRGGRLKRAPSRSLLGPLALLRALLEPVFALFSPRHGEESLVDFMVRHFGAETGQLLATVLANGVYAGDPRRLSSTEAFPRLSALAASGAFGSLILGALGRGFRGGKRVRTGGGVTPKSLWTLRRGLHALPAAMARELGPALRLGSAVRVIAPEGAGWQVAVGAAGERFDAVICALPAPNAAKLLREVSPGAAEALDGIRYSRLAVVHLGVRLSDVRVAPRGFGVLDGDGKLTLLGTLFPSSLYEGRAPPDHALLTSMVGGMQRPELAGLDDDRLVARVRDDLAQVLGLGGTPVIHRVRRWEAAVPQYEVGHAARVLAAEREVAKLPSFHLAGAAYHGVSVELALKSGVTAARTLMGLPLDTGHE